MEGYTKKTEFMRIPITNEEFLNKMEEQNKLNLKPRMFHTEIKDNNGNWIDTWFASEELLNNANAEIRTVEDK